MARRNRYDDDPGGKFTSVVTSGNGKPVTSGSGKAVMSRSFGREPVYAPVPMTRTEKPKASPSSSTGGRVRYEKKAAPRAQEGGRVRHKAQASSTGGPARYSAPDLSYGPTTRGQRTAQTKDTGRVPGRAIVRALQNTLSGTGPTDPGNVVRQARVKPARPAKPKTLKPRGADRKRPSR